MGFVTGLTGVVYFITCIILVIVVLMQEPKGGGLSSAFGGSGLDTAFGASIGRKMSSFTVWLAVFFLILTIGLAILTKTSSGAMSGSMMQGVEKTHAPAGPGEQPADQQKGGAPGEQKGAQTPKSPQGSTPGPGAQTPAAPGEDR